MLQAVYFGGRRRGSGTESRVMLRTLTKQRCRRWRFWLSKRQRRLVRADRVGRALASRRDSLEAEPVVRQFLGEEDRVNLGATAEAPALHEVAITAEVLDQADAPIASLDSQDLKLVLAAR